MSITQQNTVLPAIGLYSALIPLLGINFDKPVTIGFSAAEVAADTFRILGTLDSAATDDTNATDLGTVAGLTGLSLPDGLVAAFSGWPYVFVQRLTGTNAGSLFVSGEASSAAVAVSAAAPAAGAFSPVLDLTGFGSDPVRIGGDNSMLAGDKFNVYVTQIAGATSAAGCDLAGTITGGGNDNGKLNSLLLQGWPYALVQRVNTGTATTGAIVACGVSPASANAPDAVRPLPNTDVRRDGSGGAYNVYEVLAADGATSAATGRIRVTGAAETVIAGDSIGGAGDIVLLAKDGADGAVIGDAVNFQGLTVTSKTAANPSPLGVTANGSTGMVVAFINTHAPGSYRVQTIIGGAGNANFSVAVDPGAAGVQLFAIADNTAALRRLQISAAGNTSLTNTGADPSALLDMSANVSLGFCAPRPTRATLLALGSPLAGLAAFDTTNNIYVVNTGTSGVPVWSRAAGGPNVRAVNTSQQSVADGVAAAAVANWTETTDTGGNFNATSGVFTAPVAGFYSISASVEFSAIAAILGAQFTIGIYVGGVLAADFAFVNPVVALSQARPVQVVHSLQLAAAATVDIRVSQNSGTGANTLTASGSRNTLSIALIN
jgi:hypothetical protein